jgi:signal transduction histidine kinase
MKIFKELFLFFLLFFVIVAKGHGITKTSHSLDTISLQLKWKHQFQFAGYYAAIEKDYYKEAGLFVRIQEAKTGNESIPSVESGESNFGIAASDLLISYNIGSPIVVLANIFQHSPHVFLSLKNSSSDNIHDFSGKSIMLESHAEELIAYLKSEQINLEELTFIPHTFKPTALIEDEIFAISAYSTDEPYLLEHSGIEFNIYNPRSSGIDFYGDVLFTSKKEIENHPERVNKFLKATLKGWSYALNNQDEIVNLIYNRYSKRHSIEHLQFEARQTNRLIMPDVVEIGYVNANRWQRIGEIYEDLGMIASNFSIDGFVYNRNPEISYWIRYRTTFIVVVIALLIALVAVRFYKLSRKLQHESKVRHKREQQLISANAYKDKLFSIIAHDLKGPVGNINNFLDILLTDIQGLDANKQVIFNSLRESSKNTYKLLENLLTWALSQKDEILFNPQNNDIKRIIDSNIEILFTTAENKQIRLYSKCRESLFATFDKEMIDLVIRNLLSNALKYTNNNGEIIIDAKNEEQSLIVSIMDTGNGMDEKTVNNLFSIDQKKESEIGTMGEKGSGLGLILCKDFVKKHKGNIWVESKLGIGSTFYFSL